MEIDARRSDDPMTDPLIGEIGPPEYDPVAQGISEPPPGYTMPAGYNTQTLTATGGPPSPEDHEESGDIEDVSFVCVGLFPLLSWAWLDGKAGYPRRMLLLKNQKGGVRG